jgi:DNA polymerase
MQHRDPLIRAGRVRAGDLATVAEVSAAAASCDLCRLCHDRSMVVVGSGPEDADVLVVAEAPGYHEDREGRLLAGRTGELFDRVLADAGLTREEIYLTSVVKCRPPTGRTPFPDEVEACEGWLFREIALVQPKVVVTLGQLALRLVTGRVERLADVHGAMLHAQVQGRDLVVWPLFHPAAALHVHAIVDQLRDDARALGGLLRGARAEEREPEPDSEPEHTTPELELVAEPAAGTEPPAAATESDSTEPQLAFEI